MSFSDAMTKIEAQKDVWRTAAGVTKYIHQTLRNGVGAYQRAHKIKSASSAKGLRLGRKCDTEFQRVVKCATGNTLNVTGCSVRIKNVFKALSRLNIRVVATQVPVSAEVQPGVRLKTRLDGLGYIEKSKTFVVIELKTTQHSAAEHAVLYKSPCCRYPAMANGLDNSEYTSHMLQTYFGCLGFAKTFGWAKTEGVVLVSSKGSAVHHYIVPERFKSMGHFRVRPMVRAGMAPSATPRKLSGLTPFSLTDAAIVSALTAKFGKVTGLRQSSDRCIGTYTAAKSKKRIVCAVAAAGQAKGVATARARLEQTSPKSANVARVVMLRTPAGLKLARIKPQKRRRK
jgi:hypothetical protein